ncbi:sulfotransferase [Sphingorhabdus sp.]|jgi:tetratricopeptide (TPR) repeat protein|uniref:tetratricopeptide repeat-containing sulfotransferase family protein n=1 Tax=Sphingorhabdus sp. TaxID=1902408 RepID=UPI0037CB9A35
MIPQSTDPVSRYVNRGIRNPDLIEAASAINEDRLADAEPLLRAHLRQDPLDVAAIRLMAQLAARLGRYKDSEALLRRALELAPDFIVARSNLAGILYRQNRFEETVELLNDVLAAQGDDAGGQSLMAAALGRIGEYDEALALYGALTERFPQHAKLWMSYGHVLKTVGKQDEGVAAYRRALAEEPTLGEVWWSLANLKTVQFDAADIAAMEDALNRDESLSDDDRLHLHFALGKAYDDRREAEASFGHYDRANRIRHGQLEYDPDIITAHVDTIIARFTPEFLSNRSNLDEGAADPIFILGMPRAGSTLLEQILASHSLIEGTMELPDMPAIAIREGKGVASGWVDAVVQMSTDRLAELGDDFLNRTRVQRKTHRPFFIDKLPNNWIYTGLIHLILPNAKIIDARRHPLDCCFSNFRQHFAKGQAFSYSLSDMGRYYADYVRLMAHFDRVLPGRVHRVIHEQLIEEPEVHVRAMLDYVGVPFEEACLNFHENRRAVRTASSEQVRRPINRDGVDQWRAYEKWLDPLKSALGSLWHSYPAVDDRAQNAAVVAKS